MDHTDIEDIHFTKMGSGDPVLILHGLFGSGANWQAISRHLAGEYEVFALDLRNHGKSLHGPQFNYDVMADDVLHFIRHHALNKVSIIGHSMGGKVAMNFAFRYPDFLHRLVVVDITHKRYEAPNHAFIEALHVLDISKISKLKHADDMLRAAIPDEGLRLFLLSNLKRKNDGKYQWQVNLEAIRNGYQALSGEVTGKPFENPCLFIRGEHSEYLLNSDRPDILSCFPLARLVTIPKAGHWVHIDARDAFIDAVLTYFRNEAID